MRILLFLTFLTFSASAIGIPQQLEISDADLLYCLQQSAVAAAAWRGSRSGVTLDEQLTDWDKYTASKDAEGISKAELSEFRSLMIFMYTEEPKYPDTTGNEIRDLLYGTCVKEKSKAKLTFF